MNFCVIEKIHEANLFFFNCNSFYFQNGQRRTLSRSGNHRIRAARCFRVTYYKNNFQYMKSPVELNSLLSKFFCYISWFVISLDQTRLWTTCKRGLYVNPIVSSKQQLSGLKITNWETNNTPTGAILTRKSRFRYIKIWIYSTSLRKHTFKF